MQCSRCHKEITASQSYVNKGRVYCEDCLMDVGLNTRECDPWATYVDNRTRAQAGQTGTDGLTEGQKRIYGFVKERGKATRQEVMNTLGLNDADLQLDLLPLLHTEMVKEKSESGRQFLVVLK